MYFDEVHLVLENINYDIFLVEWIEYLYLLGVLNLSSQKKSNLLEKILLELRYLKDYCTYYLFYLLKVFRTKHYFK